MKDHRTILPVNGVGPAAGKSPRDYLRERVTARPIPARIVATLNPAFFGVDRRELRRAGK